MRSTFHGLETLKRGIYAQQNAIYTTGHNIANANTSGYSRQRVNMGTMYPLDPIGANRSKNPGQLGTGVIVRDIVRLREGFLDSQFRHEHGRFGEWEIRLDTLQKLEAMMNEPSDGDPANDTGLGALIDQFWEAWDTLSADPSSNRVVVIESMRTLTEAFNIRARQLSDLRRDLEESISIKENRVNELLDQIRDLNEHIAKVEMLGDNANDLRDQRDLLVDELSKLIDIRVHIDTDDSNQEIYTIVLANADENGDRRVLLQGTDEPDELKIVLDEGSEPGDEGIVDGGEIGGLLKAIKDVDRYHAELDTLVDTFVQGEVEVTLPAGTVLEGDVDIIERHDDGRITVRVNGVNGLHELGWRWDENGDPVSGGPLFEARDGDGKFTAENIRVSSILLQDETLLAPSHRHDAHGSNGIARAIASLREDGVFNFRNEDESNERTINEGTIRDYYRAYTAKLGLETESAIKKLKNQTVVLGSIDMRRASVSAVSLDEEMVNLIQFQHAYNAAARNMTVIDEMLDRVINGMGRVGR